MKNDITLTEQELTTEKNQELIQAPDDAQDELDTLIAINEKTFKSPHVKKEKGERDMKLYMAWKSMPESVKKMPTEKQKALGYNVNSAIFQKLISIKSDSDFCQAFRVNKNGPSRWKRRKEFWDQLDIYQKKQNVMRFQKDVDFSFTQATIENADAARVKLWKQLNEGWSEKTENLNVNVTLTPAQLVEEIEKRNREIRGN